MTDRSPIAGWSMSPQLREAWNFRAEAPPTSGQEPTAGTGQEPTTASGQAPEASQSLAEVQAALQAARREAAANRTKLAAFERAQQEAETAKLGELEGAKKRAADLEAENKRIQAEALAERTNARIERQAAALGAVDPELVTRLIDPGAIERDAAGTPTNLESLIKDVLKRRPYLAAGAQGQIPAAGATNPAGGRSASGLTLDDVKKMTPAQINARWAEVSKVLAGS